MLQGQPRLGKVEEHCVDGLRVLFLCVELEVVLFRQEAVAVDISVEHGGLLVPLREMENED